MTDDRGESVTVRIAGEEHTIRSKAKPEYTTRCAEYLDRRMREIKKQIGLVDGHKVAILAALSITDELFQSQDARDLGDSRIAERLNALAVRVEDTVSGA